MRRAPRGKERAHLTRATRLSTVLQILIFLPLTLVTLSKSAFLLLSLIHSLLTGECRGGEAKAETAEDGVARALPGVGVDTIGDLLHGI